VVRLLFALYVGRGLVVLRKFDAHKAKAAIEAHGIDNLTINPAMLRMLLDAAPPIADLGAVRYVSSGTAPLPSSLREEFEARFEVPVLQSYGQTEAFGGIAIESARDVLDGRRRPSSVGKPLPGVEVRIADADGRACAPGADGEILARTKSSTAGYADDTADAGSPVDAEGWLHTGDLGHRDEDGYLYVTGRLKSIIICGGFNDSRRARDAWRTIRTCARQWCRSRTILGEIPVMVGGRWGSVRSSSGWRAARRLQTSSDLFWSARPASRAAGRQAGRCSLGGELRLR
jgi:long-chain acyl-CoA synthetase